MGCYWDFPDGTVVKNLPVSAEDTGDTGLIPGSGISDGERNGIVFLQGKFHGQRSLAGYKSMRQLRRM